jgi:hypothetical protein
MSSRSHCADIIANCIDVGTKQRGGERSALSLSVWQTLCGARRIRSRDLGFALEPVLIRASARGGRPWSCLVRRFEASLWPGLKPHSSIQRSLLGRNGVKRKPEYRALGPTTKPMRSLTPKPMSEALHKEIENRGGVESHQLADN